MNIRQVGAELVRGDRQKNRRTDMTKLIVAFLNFTNSSKNWIEKCSVYKPYMFRSVPGT